MNRRDGNKIDRNLIYVVAFILITVISLGYKLFLSGTFEGLLGSKNDDDLVIEHTDETASSAVDTSAEFSAETSQMPDMVSVYICGEVNSPGVYEVLSGSIIYDVVELAGGFTESAAEDRLNLVYIIDSNISIYIPGEDEIYEQSEIVRADGDTIWGNGSPNADGNYGTGDGSLVNINTASREQLMSLPGIGEVTAQAIIDYRGSTPFARIEDIMNVTGIGEAKFNNIRDLICV